MISTQAILDEIKEFTGDKLTLEQANNILNRDFAPVAADYKRLASAERAPFYDEYASSGNREKALEKSLGNWDKEFGSKRVVREIRTNRDIYDNLREIYNQSGGDWELVAKVAKYNNVPKTLMDKFVKNGEWTDFSEAEGIMGALQGLNYGMTENLAGGIGGALGGDSGLWDEVPRGVSYEDQVNTGWRRGVQESEALHQSRMDTDPGKELATNVAGFLGPAAVSGGITAGLKVLPYTGRAARAVNALVRSGATGALASTPGIITKESVGDALGHAGENAAAFMAGDVIAAGAGKVISPVFKGAKKLIQKAKPRENIVKGVGGVKSFDKMSDVERQTALKYATKAEDGSYVRNISREMAEKGAKGVEEIDNVVGLAKSNRPLYNKLKAETEHFNLADEISAASKANAIPNAPLSRVNQLLRTIPERLAKFTDDALGYKSFSGHLIKTMEEFNADIKHALRSIKNPNAAERSAIEGYLKDVESANMMQHIKNKLPLEYAAKDVDRDLFNEMSRLFQITNPFSAAKALQNVAQNRSERELITNSIKGRSVPPKALPRLNKIVARVKDKKTQENIKRLLTYLVKDVQDQEE